MTNDPTTTTGSVAPEQWPTEVLDAARQVRGDQPTPTLVDRARAAYEQQQRQAAENAESFERQHRNNLLRDAAAHAGKVLYNQPEIVAYSDDKSDQWAIVEDGYAPTAATTTTDGLRFRFEQSPSSYQGHSLYLVEPCLSCGADDRRALVRDLPGLHAMLAADRDAPGTEWHCITCQYRAAEDAELALAPDQRTEIDAPHPASAQAANDTELLDRASEHADWSRGHGDTTHALTALAYIGLIFARDIVADRVEVE